MLTTPTLQVAQMTKSDLDSYDAIFLTSGLMWINQSKDPLITEYNLLQIVCVSPNLCRAEIGSILDLSDIFTPMF